MKLIIAVVRPHRLDEIVCALENVENFPGITVTDAEGFGQRLRKTDDALNPFKEKKRIKIACNDKMVEPIVAAIRKCGHTGKKGGGIILVTLPAQTVFSSGVVSPVILITFPAVTSLPSTV